MEFEELLSLFGVSFKTMYRLVLSPESVLSVFVITGDCFYNMYKKNWSTPAFYL